jgi:hypothetical protein
VGINDRPHIGVVNELASRLRLMQPQYDDSKHDERHTAEYPHSHSFRKNYTAGNDREQRF